MTLDAHWDTDFWKITYRDPMEWFQRYEMIPLGLALNDLTQVEVRGKNHRYRHIVTETKDWRENEGVEVMMPSGK